MHSIYKKVLLILLVGIGVSVSVIITGSIEDKKAEDSSEAELNVRNIENKKTEYLCEVEQNITESIEDKKTEDSRVSEPNNRYSCIAVEEGFEITFYSSTNDIIFSECYPIEPGISQITENIFKVSISFGSPAVDIFYIDMENAEISETFFNPIFIGERNVAYMEDGNLILKDIFNEDLLYMTISRDFTKTANPVSAIIAIEMRDEKTITLSYFKGDNYEETSETITIDTPCANIEQGEIDTETSYEVYVSQYTLSTGYTMKVFQVSDMKDMTLENKVNESLNSKLYILEEPWFSPENISENKPIIHYQTDRYLSVEYSFEYLAAYYWGTPSWHHCVTVDMQSGEVIYFDDLIDLSEAFAKKVKYDSVLHMEGYSLWMEEDCTVLANRYARKLEIESILNAFKNFTHDFLYGDHYRENGYDMVYSHDPSIYQTAFYLEEGKICFTVPYDSAYEIEWIMLDDIEDHLKVPKWTECSGHMREGTEGSDFQK